MHLSLPNTSLSPIFLCTHLFHISLILVPRAKTSAILGREYLYHECTSQVINFDCLWFMSIETWSCKIMWSSLAGRIKVAKVALVSSHSYNVLQYLAISLVFRAVDILSSMASFLLPCLCVISSRSQSNTIIFYDLNYMEPLLFHNLAALFIFCWA
jgi:hypothetical protein